MTLWFTTLTLFGAEAMLLVLFLTGGWMLVRRWVEPVVRRAAEAAGVRVVATPVELARWCVWLVVFVAVWSVVFKAVLYTTLRHSTAHVLLSKGQSLGIAIPAEVLILLMVLVGAVYWVVKGVRYVEARTTRG